MNALTAYRQSKEMFASRRNKLLSIYAVLLEWILIFKK